MVSAGFGARKAALPQHSARAGSNRIAARVKAEMDALSEASDGISDSEAS